MSKWGGRGGETGPSGNVFFFLFLAVPLARTLTNSLWKSDPGKPGSSLAGKLACRVEACGRSAAYTGNHDSLGGERVTLEIRDQRHWKHRGSSAGKGGGGGVWEGTTTEPDWGARLRLYSTIVPPQRRKLMRAPPAGAKPLSSLARGRRRCNMTACRPPETIPCRWAIDTHIRKVLGAIAVKPAQRPY